MKNIRYIKSWPLIFLALTAYLLMCSLTATGQDEEPKEKKRARISLEYFHLTDSAPYLRATIKTRVDRVYETVSGVKVNFFVETDEGRTSLGEVTSNAKGEAKFELDPQQYASVDDTVKTRLFVATIEDNPEFHDADQDIEITVSQMDMKFEEVDSNKMVTVFFGMPDSSGNIAPVEGTYVNFFVKRMFGALPFGDDYEMTDEEGLVSVQLPDDIPGDEEGELTIIARSEGDEYGIRSVEKTISWGVPLISDPNEWDQTLWASRNNTPIVLLVVVNVILIGIWGVIAYIVIQLFRIRSIGKRTS